MKKNQILNGLTILGILCCVELAIVYYQANYNPYSEPSFCNINTFVDCDGVAQTSKAVFLGIPLTYWGFFLYFFILMLLNIDKLKILKGLWFLKVFKNPYSYISVLGIVSFIISVFLAFVSIFQIHKICILCFVTYFINLAIGLIATDFNNGGFKKSLKDSYYDFISGVKEATVPFLIALMLGGIFLSYTTIEMPFASRKQSIKHFMFMKNNPYKVSGNFLGNPTGEIRIELYTDFACPVCHSYNIMLHKLVKKHNNILVIHHNFPLDTECNKYLEKQMHKGACRLARYGIAAENQGKYWDMANAIFEKNPKNDEEGIEIASKIGLDVGKFIADINSIETNKRLQEEIDEAINKGVDGTPTIIVDDRMYHVAKPYFELEKLIIRK
ncbi:thioredoxin domain-containing protein [bacterium]|nr:thioredoxin domain-containing protein [bacterium]